MTEECVSVIERLLQCDVTIARACLLTVSNRHGMMLTLAPMTLLAIKSGFSSGYAGEGPTGLSRVLRLLDGHGVEIEEIAVEAALLDRLDESALTKSDINEMGSVRPIRPQQWREYLNDNDADSPSLSRIWRDAPAVIPFAIVDPRIIDLAISFWRSPDERLMTGYRRLEGIVRTRTGIDDHGCGLFSAAFMATPAPLVWKGVTPSEQKGRAQLFVAAYMAFRNPRAHRELKSPTSSLLSEFLLLNHLYSLESSAE